MGSQCFLTELRAPAFRQSGIYHIPSLTLTKCEWHFYRCLLQIQKKEIKYAPENFCYYSSRVGFLRFAAYGESRSSAAALLALRTEIARLEMGLSTS